MRDKYQSLLRDRVELLGAVRHENVREVSTLFSVPMPRLRAPPAPVSRADLPKPLSHGSVRYWHPRSGVRGSVRRLDARWRSARGPSAWTR